MAKVWGPLGWMALHSISVCYPLEPTYEEKLICMRFIELFGDSITCRYCKDHYQKMHQTYKTMYPGYLNSKRDLFLFITRMHNSVNKKLDKPVIQSVKDSLELLQANTKSVTGQSFRDQYINYLIRNWSYDMTGEGMIMKAKAYELQKINNSYWNPRNQDFNIELEEADIVTPIPESTYSYTSNGIFKLNPINFSQAGSVGFKGGKLSFGRR